MSRILADEAFDEVDLLQGHLYGVSVLRAARSVRHPELKTGDAIITTQLPRAINGLLVDVANAPG